MDTEEIWKDVPGYEGYYMASNLGRIKSLDRQKRTRSGGSFLIKGAIKNPYPQADGYMQIGLSKDGRKVSFLLHRLIGMTFIAGDTSLEINHIDFDRKNCRVDNLEWETRIGNIEYSLLHGRYQNKDQRNLTKLKREQVIEIRKMHGHVPIIEIAPKFGVSVGAISQIVNRRSWKYVT